MYSETASLTTYITPWDSAGPELMAEFLAGAKQSIRFIIYGATLPQFFDGLVAAHKRGVDVRGVFDHTQAAGRAESQMLHALFLQIPASNFLIGTSPKAHQICHLKGSWIDGQTVWSGSWNYSTDATSQVNNIDIVQSTKRAAAFQSAFDELWQFISTHEQAYQPKAA